MSQKNKQYSTATTTGLTLSITLDSHVDDEEDDRTLYEMECATNATKSCNIRDYINRLLDKNNKTPSI